MKRYLVALTNETSVSIDDRIPLCSWLADILFAVYAFAVCIVLINLLIATYSATFTNVAQDANSLWLSYRIDIITEYIRKPLLPPPLIVFGHVWILILIMRKKFSVGDDLKLNFDGYYKNNKIEESLNKLERDSVRGLITYNAVSQSPASVMEELARMKTDIGTHKLILEEILSILRQSKK